MQIRFSYDTKYGKFSDALNLPDDHNYTENEINLMKEQRKDNWIAYIDSTQIETQEETQEVIVEESNNQQNNETSEPI